MFPPQIIQPYAQTHDALSRSPAPNFWTRRTSRPQFWESHIFHYTLEVRSLGVLGWQPCPTAHPEPDGCKLPARRKARGNPSVPRGPHFFTGIRYQGDVNITKQDLQRQYTVWQSQQEERKKYQISCLDCFHRAAISNAFPPMRKRGWCKSGALNILYHGGGCRGHNADCKGCF